MSFTEYYDKATIPDKTASDFYCEVNSMKFYNFLIASNNVTNIIY